MEIYEKTEGIISLEKLQNNEFKLWTVDEIIDSRFGKKQKDICLYVAKKNRNRETPKTKEINEEIQTSLGYLSRSTKKLKDKEVIFNFTVPELVGFYDIQNKNFCLPNYLDWFDAYLKKHRTRGGIGGTGCRKSWDEQIRKARANVYPRYYVANIVDSDGVPCYLPLGFHIKNK